MNANQHFILIETGHAYHVIMGTHIVIAIYPLPLIPMYIQLMAAVIQSVSS